MPRSNLKERSNRLFQTRKAPTKWSGLFLMLIDWPSGRWVPLMGGTPATHGVALAAAPWQRSHGSCFVRLRSHRPRLPNGCARWLPEVAIAPPFAGRGLSRRVAERRRATLPMGRVSSASAQPALTCPGSRCHGNRLAPCRQDMDSVARNHLAACGGGEPLLSRSRQKGRNVCCVPAQVLSPRARSGSRAPCAQVPRTPSSPSLSRAA